MGPPAGRAEEGRAPPAPLLNRLRILACSSCWLGLALGWGAEGGGRPPWLCWTGAWTGWAWGAGAAWGAAAAGWIAAVEAETGEEEFSHQRGAERSVHKGEGAAGVALHTCMWVCTGSHQAQPLVLQVSDETVQLLWRHKPTGWGHA